LAAVEPFARATTDRRIATRRAMVMQTIFIQTIDLITRSSYFSAPLVAGSGYGRGIR
jgi:hypothetical protein